MKYFKRLKLYKSSNLTLDIENGIAYSYGWYEIAKRVDGQWYVNDYSYSQSTIKHAIKIKSQLQDLGLDFETIEAPRGLQKLDQSKSFYIDKIENLNTLINKKGTRKDKNIERMNEISKLQFKINLVETLINENV